MKNELEQLKLYTKIVVDSCDFESFKHFNAEDATTNPSLLLKAIQQKKYQYILEKSIKDIQYKSLNNDLLIDEIINNITVLLGIEILKIVPGRVSTEINPNFSFNIVESINQAKKIIKLYEKNNIPRERILIKIPATWEGIEVAKNLYKQKINCNMTLVFSLLQAVCCARNNIAMISPFVGRIYDFFKNKNLLNQFNVDPGVSSVINIFNYYKKFGYRTEIMGASFRNKNQILSLTGCDLLTISPNLLNELQDSFSHVSCQLNKENAKTISNIQLDDILSKKDFIKNLEKNLMANSKLQEGIDLFIQDYLTLKNIIKEKL